MGKVTYSDPDQEQNPSESLEMGSDILEMTLLWTGCYFTYAPNGNILYMNCKWLFMAWQLMAWIRIEILKPSLNNFLATELGGKKKHFCLNFHIKASKPPTFTPDYFFPPSVKQRDATGTGWVTQRGRGLVQRPRPPQSPALRPPGMPQWGGAFLLQTPPSESPSSPWPQPYRPP